MLIRNVGLKRSLEKVADEIDALEATLTVRGQRASALLHASAARLRAGAHDAAWTMPNIPGFNDSLADDGHVLTKAMKLIESCRSSSGLPGGDGPPPDTNDVDAFERVCDAAKQVIRKGAALA